MSAPRVENQDNQFTKAILYAKVPFDLMTKEDKLRTCYMRACLAYVKHQAITNADVRDLFGLTESEMAKASRIIKETMGQGLIKPLIALYLANRARQRARISRRRATKAKTAGTETTALSI